MVMESERARLIGVSLQSLVVAVNNITEEDIEEMLNSLAKAVVLGPMIDPTTFQDGSLFGKMHDTEKVLRALQEFKKEVKGIGDFK